MNKLNKKVWSKGDLCEIWSRAKNEGLIGYILEMHEHDVISVATGDGVFKVSSVLIYDVGESKDAIIFPTMKRVYPALLINEIVKLEPMTMPSCKIFYTDFS